MAQEEVLSVAAGGIGFQKGDGRRQGHRQGGVERGDGATGNLGWKCTEVRLQECAAKGRIAGTAGRDWGLGVVLRDYPGGVSVMLFDTCRTPRMPFHAARTTHPVPWSAVPLWKPHQFWSCQGFSSQLWLSPWKMDILLLSWVTVKDSCIGYVLRKF